MLSKKAFTKLVMHILEQEEADKEFHEALQKYGEKDFSGFASKEPSWLANWLREAMNVEENDEDIISWWLWGAPDAGKGSEDSCTVEFPDQKSSMIIKTPNDVYDLIVLTKNEKQDGASEGIKFALKIIKQLRDTNKKTHNPGWRDRDALLHLTYDKIKNEWLLKHGNR